MADQWTQRLEGHPVNALLDEVSALLGRAGSDPTLTDQGAGFVRRAETVVGQFRARLSRADARLTLLSVLDSAAASLQSAQPLIQSFLADHGESHLAGADTHFENLVGQLWMLPPMPGRNQHQVASQAAKDYAENLYELESAVRGRLARLVKKIEEASGTVAGVDQRLTGIEQAAEAKATHIAADSDAKLAELRSEVDSQKGRLDEAISQMQANFAQEQGRQLQEFNQGQKNQEGSFAQFVDRLTAEHEAHFGGMSQDGQSILAALEEHETRAARIVGVTAAAGVAGAYNTEAKEQKTEADRWRLVAAAVLAMLLLGAILVPILGPPDETSTAEILSFSGPRVAIGGALLAVFTYAARESGKHRDRERNARQRGMELTAFRPFLAELPEQDVHGEIKAATGRYFRGDELPVDQERKP